MGKVFKPTVFRKVLGRSNLAYLSVSAIVVVASVLLGFDSGTNVAEQFRQASITGLSAMSERGAESVDAPGNTLETPRLDRNAELLAISSFGDLFAQPQIYSRVEHDLALIEQKDTILSGFPVYPYFVPDRLKIILNKASLDLVHLGEYREWDSLNKLFRVNDVIVNEDHILIKYDARLNMPRVAQLYGSLDGVLGTELVNINPLLTDAYKADICLSVEAVSGAYTYIYFQRSSSCFTGHCSVYNYKAYRSERLDDSSIANASAHEQNKITSLGEWQWSDPGDLAGAPNWFVKNSCKGEFWQPLGRGLSHYVESVRLSMSPAHSNEVVQ